MNIDVAFTPAAVHPAQTAVVVDTLRATSSICVALDAGYDRVLCCAGLDEARALSGPGRVLAGERGCLRPPGFDLGNSPGALNPPLGSELVLATTNGTPALLAAAACAEEVLAGALLNLDALCGWLDGADTLIVCAGTGGAPAIEDVYVAGRIVGALAGRRTDAALIAEAVARAHRATGDALAGGAGARALRRVGMEDDIDHCARESVLEVVPRLIAFAAGVAALEGAPRAVSHRDISMRMA